MEYFCGLDLGQKPDYSALAVIRPVTGWEVPTDYHLGFLERVGDVPYYHVVEGAKKLLTTLPYYKNTQMVIDATGVGRPVCDDLRRDGVPFIGVTITGGEQEHPPDKENRYWRVPKAHLIVEMLVLFENRRLRIAENLLAGEQLRKELSSFQRKPLPSGRERFEHREGENDDLLLATALACWAALKFGGGVSEVSSTTGPFKHKGELPFQAKERPFERTREFSW